jgi:hypothetical protein
VNTLLWKMLLAGVLILGGLGWALWLRAGGSTENLPIQGMATFLGFGILVGTLWEDDRA